MPAVPPIGFTGTLTVNDGASNAQQAFAFPVSISPVNSEVDKVDASYLGMATRDKLYFATLYDTGTLAFTIQYTKADFVRLQALKGISKTWVVTYPTDTVSVATASYTGFLIKFPTKFTTSEIIMMECEIQISGAITYT